ncbi:nascent polypeptide-associated complex subunit alpha, muscle-specific form isoform X2 [Episyrphus balteatus]|uniref:nascent polypeptide-associated complex subunit alpha, muscle-specific form isoform X2 n=1 Tax=Episyrphus balteatus TaxID=286459 RepID=UPI002485F521|nr:nascent polypeptide-associated complex subunit alpha, muscle-specific form isoform X2 [Episyrphus balteatus]
MGGTVKKKRGPRINQPSQPLPVTGQPPMARVNPVKTPNSTVAVKKTQAPLPNDNFKIQLPSKRPTQPNQSDLVPPEKRVRRVKPTTIIRSNDEEWIKRQPAAQWNGGERPKANSPAITKNLVNVVKNAPTRVVKSPTPVGLNTPRGTQNNVNQNNPIQPNVKNPTNFVRMAWNGKNPKPASPPVINKNITTTLKEQPKSLPIPPVINKNITATAKDPNIPSSLSSSPVFNKNSVTIRRIVVNDDSPKPVTLAKSITTTAPKAPIVNQNSPNIKRVPPTPLAVDPLKITMSPSKNLNNSSIKVTPINAKSPATPVSQTSSGFKKIPSTASELVKGYQHLPTLKRNETNAKPQLQDPIAVVSTSPTMLYSTPPTIKKMVNMELPTKPTAASTIPVISKVFGSGKKPINEEQPLIHLGTSVIKNQTKLPEPKILPTVAHKSPPAIINRSSGLIVTPITCTIATTTTTTATPTYNMPSNLTPTSSRGASKQSKASINRNRAFQAAQAEQALASMFSMFPPSTFMGNPQMMYDMDPSGGAFINPACIPNRPMRTMEGPSFPTVGSPGFHVNYPNFSGGSITPVMSPGPGASPTYSSGRSSKSPVTSTVTRPSGATRSPASYMGISIDVDQPIPPMSPPVYNMNHAPFNGDPFNFMRNPHNIPSPSFSPVRSTRSPLSTGQKTNNKGVAENVKPPASSPVFHKDLDNFVKNPYSYPQTPNSTKTMPSFSNGPIISLDSPPKNDTSMKSPIPVELHKNSTINVSSSPDQSEIRDGSSASEVYAHNLPPNGKEKPSTLDNKKENDNKAEKDNKENKCKNKQNDVEEVKKDNDGEEEEEKEADEEEEEEEEKEPLIPEFENLLKACREADSSEDMNRLIDSKLIRYYYSVHPDFVKSRGFKKAVKAATESISKNAELVYYHLRPVVEELKARKKCKSIVMTNDEISAVAAEAEQEGIEDKVRNRQIRRLNKGLYILTRKIHKLETDEVDLEDENSTYLIVERYKKRACEIYDKICDLTGESKHALRQVKKPITFKDTDYPKFNKVVETFVNKTKEFPDFVDVLRMLEFCNDRYNFGLIKEEMTSIAQGAFIKIGKLLQSRRKADLYETVSHFTSDLVDPAENDPVLLAKLTENEKNQTTIGSVIEKYAREQVRRKADLTSVSDDEVNNSSESCDSEEEESHNIKQSKLKKNNNKTNNKENNKLKEKYKDKHKEKNKETDEEKDKDKGTDEEKEKRVDEKKDNEKVTEKGKEKNEEKVIEKDKDKTDVICQKTTEASTNGTYSPPSASVVVPQSVPMASTSAAFRTSPPHAFESPEASPRPRSLSPLMPSCTTSSLKILSVTSLNESADTPSPKKNNDIIKPAAVVGSVDEIVISDEDL